MHDEETHYQIYRKKTKDKSKKIKVEKPSMVEGVKKLKSLVINRNKDQQYQFLLSLLTKFLCKERLPN
jgi:hypothetical protein